MALDALDADRGRDIVEVSDGGGTLLLVPRDASRTIATLRARFGDDVFSKVAATPDRVAGALMRDPDAVARLRAVLVFHHLLGPTHCSDRRIKDYVLRSVGPTQGSPLIAILLPPNTLSASSTRSRPDGVPVAEQAPPGKAVSDMSVNERIFAMLVRMRPYLAKEAPKALLEAVNSFLTPQAVLVVVACIAFLAAAQTAGVGEVADAALLAWAYGTLGWSGLCAMWRMLAAIVDAARSTSDEALEHAAHAFATNLAALGVDFLLVVITWATKRTARKGASRDEPQPARQQQPVLRERPRPLQGANASGTAVADNTETAGSTRNANPTKGALNCVNCIMATDSILRGNPASALPGGPYPISVLEQQFGSKFSPTTLGDIESTLQQQGNGATGIVFGSRPDLSVGHVFNAVNQDGVVRFVDGRIGAVHLIRLFGRNTSSCRSNKIEQ